MAVLDLGNRVTFFNTEELTFFGALK